MSIVETNPKRLKIYEPVNNEKQRHMPQLQLCLGGELKNALKSKPTNILVIFPNHGLTCIWKHVHLCQSTPTRTLALVLIHRKHIQSVTHKWIVWVLWFIPVWGLRKPWRLREDWYWTVLSMGKLDAFTDFIVLRNCSQSFPFGYVSVKKLVLLPSHCSNVSQ